MEDSRRFKNLIGIFESLSDATNLRYVFSVLALSSYLRCRGSRLSPVIFAYPPTVLPWKRAVVRLPSPNAQLFSSITSLILSPILSPTPRPTLSPFCVCDLASARELLRFAPFYTMHHWQSTGRIFYCTFGAVLTLDTGSLPRTCSSGMSSW